MLYFENQARVYTFSLYKAAEIGPIPLMSVFHIQKDAPNINRIFATNMRSVLHAAAEKGHAEAGVWLLGMGAKSDEKDA
jgi:hypothetical protein